MHDVVGQMHSATFSEAVPHGLVQFGRKALSPVSRQGGVKVAHGDDGSNALENHVRHDARMHTERGGRTAI